MALKKQKEKKLDWLLVLIVFLLGISLAMNAFLFLEKEEIKTDMTALATEIKKLQTDDLAIAQAFNNLTVQLQAMGILQKTANPNE